jgi:excisionase family DNA binding protein
MQPQEKPLITPLAVRSDQAARMLGIGRTSLHNLMKSGKIPYTKLNRAVLFRISDLDDFLKTPPKINKA